MGCLRATADRLLVFAAVRLRPPGVTEWNIKKYICSIVWVVGFLYLLHPIFDAPETEFVLSYNYL